MPSKKKMLAAAALTASLTAGGALGAMFGAPAVSLAQGGPEQGVARAEQPAEEGESRGVEPAMHPAGEGQAHPADGQGDGRHHARHAPRRLALEAAAEALGMTPEELRRELQAGKSVRTVGEERGVDVQTVIDAIVAAVTEHAEARAEEFVNRERPAGEGEADRTAREAPTAEGTAA